MDNKTSYKNSPFYSKRPVFVTPVLHKRGARLEGNRALLVFAVVVMVLAALSGMLFFSRNSGQTITAPVGSDVPANPPGNEGTISP